MSDLVEKVTQAILGFDHLTDQQWAPHWKAIKRNGITPPKAKRAIKAVAEWLDTVMDDRVAASDLMKQLKEGSE